MTQLEFMGFVLSQNGIGAAEEKVKAVANAREPENVLEVKFMNVFLGFVNNNARLIPDFATITEPLWASSLAVRALAYCAEDHGSGPT